MLGPKRDAQRWFLLSRRQPQQSNSSYDYNHTHSYALQCTMSPHTVSLKHGPSSTGKCQIPIFTDEEVEAARG